MEEVLGGYHPHHRYSQSTVGVEISDISDILSSAKSTSLRRTSDNISLEEKYRRTSTGSRNSYNSTTQSHSSLQSLGTRDITMSPHKLNLQGSQQSLNREVTMSPHRMITHGSQQSLGSRELPHGSHQSLGSRELPPLPGQSYLGSQQSLASKEIQQIGTKDMIDPLHYSPFHSREGSLDNEAFLYHRFTQGSSLADPYKKAHGSSDELSSDTAMYEQEFRRYHLENIQEVSNTLERSGEVRKSVISQNLNISYNSVYDLKSQQTKFRISNEEKQRSNNNNSQEQLDQLSPRSKIPYYVSDLSENGDNPKNEANTVVDAITKSMKALDVESKSYFQTSRHEAENERIRKLRRSYTPDPYLNKQLNNSQQSQAQQHDKTPVEQGQVGRSKSLEGLLGDSQGSVKDNLGYPTINNTSAEINQERPYPKVYSPHNFNDITSEPRPARGVQPPPPPEGVPPLDISEGGLEEDDGTWADTLRFGVKNFKITTQLIG